MNALIAGASEDEQPGYRLALTDREEEVLRLVQGIVREVNDKFARVENIRKFRMIPKALDHEDGELTATQKLKRSAMADMFSELIEEMYGSRE